MPLKLNSSGGGSVTLDTPSTASAFTLTVPAITGTAVVTGSTATVSQAMLASNVAGNGPAFSAYQSVAQTLATNTFTKLQFQTEEFDTNNNFDNTTNYRFTPTVAGYYQMSGGLSVSSSVCGISVAIYKNGSRVRQIFTLTALSCNCGYGSALVYMNGSTDYVELYGFVTIGQALGTGADSTYFQAALVRAA